MRQPLDSAEIAEALGRSEPYEAVAGRWTPERAWKWYDRLPWQAGCNYYPATAINQIEMWQASTFDIATIDREMQWSADLGFTTHRVFLHDLVWADDADGLYQRMDRFLDCCVRHGIRPFFVFFNDCHQPTAKLGPQPLPVPGYHNSGWVTSPERATALRFALGQASAEEYRRLRGYVHDTIARFADDDRVLMWELYNEPGRGARNPANIHADHLGDEGFGDMSARLVHASWEWAREAGPSQPITSNSVGCVGSCNWSINFLNSDVHSIHRYGPPEQVIELVRDFQRDGRPLFMTEYLAREFGSTFQAIMPLLAAEKVAAINWGFVAGKAGTVWNWRSRFDGDVFQNAMDLRAQGRVAQPGEALPEPQVWFHDILRPDGTPYDEDEIATIKRLTGART